MKLAVIAPPNQLDWILYSSQMATGGRYQMCLARKVLTDDGYAAFYATRRRMGDFVIMDNGAAEEGPLPPEDLWKAYNIVKPTEIVVPDKVNDPVRTKELTDLYFDLCPTPRMVVPQGATLAEWADCLDHQLKAGWVVSIGVSKYCPVERPILLQYLQNSGYTPSYDVHLLGVRAAPAEVVLLKKLFPWVRGVDTAAPVAFGLKGYSVHSYHTSGHIGLDWDAPVPAPGSEIYQLIENNIDVMLQWAGGIEVADAAHSH